MLDHTLTNKLINLLLRLPFTSTFSGRTALLQGLPDPSSLVRSEENRRLDLVQLVQQLDQLGRLRKNGVRPLLVLAENGLASIQGWDGEMTDAFAEVMDELSDYYGGELTITLDAEPDLEKLLFHVPLGSVGQDFFSGAAEVARSVARLRVPAIYHGIPDMSHNSFGTGWLIAPDLLITNYHVVEARAQHEEPATYTDICAQVHAILVWFDFWKEQSPPSKEYQGAELVAQSQELDYALLRLKDGQQLVNRKPLAIIATKPTLQQGDHLNIVQYPRGGPLRYAIRNNYYVKNDQVKDHLLHYLTDTEPGSSGSPVLNDAWHVLALHHAARPTSPRKYNMEMQGLGKRKIVNHYNEGIALYKIVEDLPTPITQEIQQGQLIYPSR
ncbi:MAG TPA: serine protease [Ktedonobacteraceae bacterium]